MKKSKMGKYTIEDIDDYVKKAREETLNMWKQWEWDHFVETGEDLFSRLEKEILKKEFDKRIKKIKKDKK